MGVKNVAYTGLATYGRVRAVMGFVGALLIGGIFIVFGMWVALSKDNRTSTAVATASSASCNTSMNPPECFVTLQFRTTDGKNVVAYTSTGSKMYTGGERCEVRYDPDNPSDIQIGESKKWLGWVFVGVGLVLIMLGSLSLYFSMKYKEVAAIGGGVSLVGDVIDMVD